MFIAPAKSKGRATAFTLLEIMLSVAILGMMSIAIYRFVQTNLSVLRISSEANRTDAQYSGLAHLIESEWQSLPSGRGSLLGEAVKLNDRSRDVITWVSSAGPGLLTRYAAGEYSVSMRLRPATKSGDEMEIGLARKAQTDVGIGESENESWVPLLGGVQSMQIRYFDPRLNTWVDNWTDTVTLPRLVKVIIGRMNNSVPWEAIIALGRTPL